MFGISVIIYWSLAFTISSAIPQFSNVSSLVASVCVFRESLFTLSFQVVDAPKKKEFTYTFPPFMILGYVMQRSALSGDKPYDVSNPHASRVDSWRDWSRWTRACMSPIILSVLSWLIAGFVVRSVQVHHVQSVELHYCSCMHHGCHPSVVCVHQVYHHRFPQRQLDFLI